MFGFSKKDKKRESEAIDAQDVLGETAETTGEDGIETELYIPDNREIAHEDRYIYAFHNSQSPKLKPNQLSLYGVELTELRNGSISATGLIRSSVEKPVKFGNTTILLLGPGKEVLARKEFDLSRAGSIPPKAARPWKFIFTREEMTAGMEIPSHGWSLAFEVKKKHQLDLEASWEKSIADDTKKNLQKIVENAAPLKPGEMNFMGLEAKRNENADLVVTILLRNGTSKNITLEQVPLGVQDADGEEIAKGSFKVNSLTIKANTSKPWSFVFPASMIQKEQPNLSSWKVYPIQ
ncbi:accessory Sec system S-layer assembly protein [Virgibacillus sediminis]|uniref:Accessory Sec system S-layer assembly protein n=1 Tax=Virgibacillus sediminis TaxID=202260 RepID=A0ABV7A3S3_9BACI